MLQISSECEPLATGLLAFYETLRRAAAAATSV